MNVVNVNKMDPNNKNQNYPVAFLFSGTSSRAEAEYAALGEHARDWSINFIYMFSGENEELETIVQTVEDLISANESHPTELYHILESRDIEPGLVPMEDGTHVKSIRFSLTVKYSYERESS